MKNSQRNSKQQAQNQNPLSYYDSELAALEALARRIAENMEAK